MTMLYWKRNFRVKNDRAPFFFYIVASIIAQTISVRLQNLKSTLFRDFKQRKIVTPYVRFGKTTRNLLRESITLGLLCL